MARLWSMVCCLALLGCSRSFDTGQVPGATGTSVSCSGVALAVRACVAQAGRACASGHYAVYELGGGGRVGDEQTGIADQFLQLVQATGATVVCTAGPPTPNLSVPPSL
jgi:hypothetical protein